MQEDPRPPSYMMAQEGIPKKHMDMERKAHILPKEELEEVNLGADPTNLGPILINSQLSVQKRREIGGATEKYI